jgi:hypothetical protein
MPSSAEVIAAARALIGTPYGHQGRTVKRLDCVGLLILVANQTGLEAGFDFTAYAKFPLQNDIRAWLTGKMGPPLGAGLARDADIVLLADRQWVCHTAWLASHPVGGYRTMIHAYAPARMVVEHALDDVWAARVRGVWRHPRLAEAS